MPTICTTAGVVPASAVLRSASVVTLIGTAGSPPVVVSTDTVPLPMPDTVAQPESGLAGGGASQEGGVSPLPAPLPVMPASIGGQSPYGSLLADRVVVGALEKQPATSASNAQRAREHTPIQSRVTTVQLRCSAVRRTAHTAASCRVHFRAGSPVVGRRELDERDVVAAARAEAHADEGAEQRGLDRASPWARSSRSPARRRACAARRRSRRPQRPRVLGSSTRAARDASSSRNVSALYE